MIDWIADKSATSLLWVFVIISVSAFLRYSLIAGAVDLGLRHILPRWSALRRVQGHDARPEDRLREFSYSALSCLIFPAFGFLVVVFDALGISRLYFYVDERGWPYFIVSIVLMVLLHDALFYWTHRLQHLPRLYRIMHAVHHRSHNPTAWAAFAFHPLEAFLQVVNIVLITSIVPAHPIAVLAFLIIMTVFNSVGHSGYEILPGRFRDSLLGKALNTATVHGWHHYSGDHNYGFYFTFWDRLMGTYRQPRFTEQAQ